MFTNLKAAAGAWVSDKTSGLFKTKQKKSSLFDDEDDFSKQVKTARPLYEKKTSTPVDQLQPVSISPVRGPLEDLQPPLSERSTNRGGPLSSLSLSALFGKKEKTGEKEKEVFTYKFIDSPKCIWDKNDLEDVLSYDDLNNGYDEEFRTQLELASKQKFKAVDLNHDKLEDYMEDCSQIELILATIDIMAHSAIQEPSFEFDCKREVSTFFVNVREDIFVGIFFKEFVEQRFDLNVVAVQSPGLEVSPKAQNPRGFTLLRFEKFIEDFNQLETELNINKRSVEKSICSIFKNKNCDFWGTCQDYFKMGEEVQDLTDSVSALRQKMLICKRAGGDKSQSLIRKFKMSQMKTSSLKLLEKARAKFSSVIRFCKLDLINANQDELPVVYETLAEFYLRLSKPDELDELKIKKICLEMILERLEIIKRRMKGTLYTYLTIFNTAQDQEPPEELIDILELYTSISEKAEDIQEKFKLDSQLFAEDVILLKAHCLQLLHMDDGLTCVHSELVMSYF